MIDSKLAKCAGVVDDIVQQMQRCVIPTNMLGNLPKGYPELIQCYTGSYVKPDHPIAKLGAIVSMNGDASRIVAHELHVNETQVSLTYTVKNMVSAEIMETQPQEIDNYSPVTVAYRPIEKGTGSGHVLLSLLDIVDVMYPRLVGKCARRLTDMAMHGCTLTYRGLIWTFGEEGIHLADGNRKSLASVAGPYTPDIRG